MELGHDGVMLSPEDVAWADSCFIKGPDTSDSSWDSFTYALLETLDTQHHSSTYAREFPHEVASMEISSSKDTGDISSLDTNDFRITATNEEASLASDNQLDNENTNDFWSSHKMEDVFLPTYNENMRDLGVYDPEVDVIFQAYELELSYKDIFKIWDLDIPPEEDDDAMKQLIMQDESLDDLITGIADLKLNPNSG